MRRSSVISYVSFGLLVTSQVMTNFSSKKSSHKIEFIQVRTCRNLLYLLPNNSFLWTNKYQSVDDTIMIIIFVDNKVFSSCDSNDNSHSFFFSYS